MDSIAVPVPTCSSPECVAMRADLAAAVDTRDTIGMAKGILMERHGIDHDEAFALLVRMSQDTNVKLRDIAANLIELRSRRPSGADDLLLD